MGYSRAGRSGSHIAVTGNPIGDVAVRDPGPRPRRRRATVVDAMRSQLDLPDMDLTLETVLFPLDGVAVWAYAGRGVLWDDDTLADLRIIVRYRQKQRRGIGRDRQ